MTDFGEEVEAQSALHTACPTASLRCIAPGDEGFHKPTNLTLFIESIVYVRTCLEWIAKAIPHLSVLSRVYDTRYVGDCNASFRDVSG